MELLRRPALLAFGLFALTLVLYWQTGDFAFLNVDDDVYVTENPHVLAGWTADGVAWAFSFDAYAANWHPLTWLSHMLDVQLFGPDAGAHHRVNAGLHALNAALCFLALLALTRALWPSLFAAALFAVHPLRVESVAWVAERKDVLAGVFFFLALLAYARHARAPSWRHMAPVVLWFALGLLAKPMLVTLPFVLLLLDRWPLARTEAWPALLREKAALFFLTALSCVVTFLVQREGGAMGALETLPVEARLATAITAYAAYLGDTLWPAGLACFYPHPAILDADYRVWGAATLGALALLAALTFGAWSLRRKEPALLMGWLWFLGMLVPVVGLVQVGAQARADRYTYLPSIGLALALAWALRGAVRGRPAATRAATALAALGIVVLSLTTWRLTAAWRTDETLFSRALAVTERNYVAHTNLGEAFLRARRFEDAVRELQAALAARPGLAPVHLNLGVARASQGRLDEAVAELRTALELYPDFADAHGTLGSLLQQRGLDAEAVVRLRRAHALEPERIEFASALAWVLATSRDPGLRDGAEAMRLADRCYRATGPEPAVLEVLAAAYAEGGRFEDAVIWQEAALERVPAAARGPLELRLRLYEDRKPYRKEP